ncbi:uncharacterized protein LOC129915678 [Episyrphus balteatus]|uniref:uncharacterized protein LOC129915678 n=1 Tax=Episyrphus balteatus TaxID=286459 RepID=UPI002485A326|nr:uncharacterized protein LOC129915678 [Episyrphus balteatus]
MGEIIQIHVGQAGVQIANACWELYCLEHGIKADGTLCECPSDNTFTNFFDFKTSDKVVPRAILVDSEPTVIDQVRTGPYGCLYSPSSLITGKEDSGSNFARGYYTMGAELIDITMEAIRNVVESCSNLRGFLIFRSIGGGTGSGLGNLIAEQLLDTYEKVAKMEFIIFPSPSLSPLIVEPYNALLATHLGMDSIECSCILDNEALYDICAKKLNINAPKYKNLNRIIGQTASNFTTSQRFSGSSNVSFSEFQTNLVPYPRIHFPVVSYAPFIPGTGSGYTRLSTEQITTACFEPSNQLVRCNPVEGKYMTSVLLYRGNVSTSDINSSITRLKATNTIRFVDWSPTGFKVGTNAEPPFSVPGGGLGNTNKSLVVLSNNTIIRRTWCRLIDKYDRLYSQRAFIHHYIAEGLEEASLAEASEDICTLISDYKEVDNAGTGGNTSKNMKCCSSKRAQSSSRSGGSKTVRSETSQKPSRASDKGVSMYRSTCAKKLSNNKSFVIENEDRTPQNCTFPQLPGLQSLNYFFGEAENVETKQKTGTKPKKSVKSVDCAGPGECFCECHVEYHHEEVTDIEGMSSQNTSSTSIRTQIFISKPTKQSSQTTKQTCQPCDSNYDRKGLSLPTRSKEILPGDRELKTGSLKKSKSFQCISSRDDSNRKSSKKRSKSHEPQRTEGIQQSGKSLKYESFDQGFNTEACRAKDRFLLTSCQTQIVTRRCVRCCPGDVLKLPPPRSEGQESLGEALSAKERFCNSTCQPSPNYNVDCSSNDFCDDQKPSCSYKVTSSDPCTTQQLSSYCPPTVNQLAQCTRLTWMAPSPNACGLEPKAPNCFCFRVNNNFDYKNSDDKIMTMCRRPSKRKKYTHTDCFCEHEIDGRFDVSNTAIIPPQCFVNNNNCVCYQEEIVCCPNDNAACESYPQCSSIIRPFICSDTSGETNPCINMDDERVNARLGGNF